MAQRRSRKALEWTIRGVVLGPRQADPRMDGSRWAAWAVGPAGERLQAQGESPNDALTPLASRLKELGA